MIGTASGPMPASSSKHRDWIEKLDAVFYVRFTDGPDYERAFICVEDGEADMHDIATTNFKGAQTFCAAYKAAMELHAKPHPQEPSNAQG